jgi:hypothetical protein
MQSQHNLSEGSPRCNYRLNTIAIIIAIAIAGGGMATGIAFGGKRSTNGLEN